MNVPRPSGPEPSLSKEGAGISTGCRSQEPIADPPVGAAHHRQVALLAPRSAREALLEGLLLWRVHLRSMLPVAALGWAPGEAVRLLALVLPQQRLGLSLLALLLSLGGAAFVGAAVIGMLAGRGAPHGLAFASLRGPASRFATDPVASIDVVHAGLARMGAVLGTQILLLCLLGAALVPGLLLAIWVGASGFARPGLGPAWPWLLALLGSLPVFSVLGLRFSLALTAAAADEAGGLRALRRSAALSRGRLEDLVAFGLLWSGVMAPLLLAMVSTWLLLPLGGLFAHGVGLCLGFVFMLQGQGAAAGLALLYADACAASHLPTRLHHLARHRQYR